MFQAEVFAWWAVRAVAGVAPELGLDPHIRMPCGVPLPAE